MNHQKDTNAAMPDPILYDSHMHTPLCNHADGEPEEYARQALRRNLKGIIFTCHNPMPDGFSADVRMKHEQFGEYVGLVRRAADAYRGKLDIRLGLECDYMPGFEPWLKEQIDSADLHFVLASVHPFIEEYGARFWKGDAVAFQRTYFENLARAAESGLFDCLSHPDLVKNMYSHEWDVPRILDDIRAALDRIAAAGIAMELNTSGWNKKLPEANPGPEILREMAIRNIPVVLGSDSHVPDRVADRFEGAMDLLEQAGYREVSFFLNRKRLDIAICEARASLKVSAVV